MKQSFLFSALLCLVAFAAQAQPDRWQQRVSYTMDVSMDVETNRYNGTQKLVYTNNSPDTLKRVFYHLYFNAFQPESMMDVRSRTIADPDGRVRDRIFNLKEEEYGYLHVNKLKQDGKSVQTSEEGTILVVDLAKPLLPGKKTTFTLEFEGQVPLQVRRSGRDNAEGVRYTMTQWYPKLAEYDYEGWQSNPYIGREFHGVWGDFDVKLTLDASYLVGGTGYLQNPQEIGYGYEDTSKAVKRPGNGKLTWHFKAPNVHDFAWAADPDYVHTKAQVPNGPMLHFFYQPGEKTTENWEQLPEAMVRTFGIMADNFGKYPYDQYSFIQGGDGGMEYAMCTMITGERSLNSLIGVSVHEGIHSWYQGVLATNESLYPWMDEGFTTYASDFVMNQLSGKNEANPQIGNVMGYVRMVESGIQEPLTTHADHYDRNRTYGINSYTKGATLLTQLNYIMGEEVFMQAMRNYYNTWKFKHPNPTDFKRVMEKTSGLELDWFFLQFVGTTNSIDYGIRSVAADGNGATITLERIGKMPMPLDVVVTYTDGSKEYFYIPMVLMRGEKNEDLGMSRTVAEDWPWVYPEYSLKVERNDIEEVAIDPSIRMADVDRANNVYPGQKGIRKNARKNKKGA